MEDTYEIKPECPHQLPEKEDLSVFIAHAYIGLTWNRS